MSEYSSLQRNEPLYLAARHRQVLLEVLQRFLPGRAVWAFGSRATGRHIGRFSDLDLAVERGLPLGLKGELMDALDESILPVNVDVVELERVDPKFAERIRGDFVLVQRQESPIPPCYVE